MSDDLNIKINISGDVSGQEDIKAFVQQLYDISTAAEKAKQELRKQTSLDIYNETKGKQQLSKMESDSKKAAEKVAAEKKKILDKEVSDEERANQQRFASQVKTIHKIETEQIKAIKKEEAENEKSFNKIFNTRIQLEKKANAQAAASEKKQLKEAMRIGLEIEKEKQKAFEEIFRRRLREEAAAEKKAQQTPSAASYDEVNILGWKFSLINQGLSVLRRGLYDVLQVAREVAKTIFDAFVAVGVEGMRVNAEFEGIKYGLTSVINAQLQLADATSGKLLDGTEKYQAATKLAADQFMKIRIEALKVQATTEELAKAYQIAVSVGAGQGITDLDKILKLTVAITNAATAMNVPMDQVPVTIRAVLTGYQATHNTVARTLGLNMGLINSWRQQGTLVKELESRLDKFSEAAQVSAKSFKVMSSNLTEAYQIISARMTEGLFASLSGTMNQYFWDLFDFKNSNFSTKYDGFIKIFQGLFDQVGTYFSETIDKIMQFVDEVNDKLKNNPQLLAQITLGFSNIKTSISEATEEVINWVKEILKVETLPQLLNKVASAIDTISAAVNALIKVFQGLWILTKIFTPFGHIALGVSKISELYKEWRDRITGNTDKVNKTNAALNRTLQLVQAIKNADTTSTGNDVGAGKYTKKGSDFLDVGLNLNQGLGAKVTGVLHPRQEKEHSQASMVSAQMSLEKAQADADLALLREKLKEQQKIIDGTYKENLISIEDYYRQRKELVDRELDEEIKVKQLERKAIDQVAAKTPLEILRKKVDLVKIDSELELLNFKRTSDHADLEAKQLADTLKLNKEMLTVKKKLSDIDGVSIESDRDTIAEQYSELIKKLTSENRADDLKLVDKLIDSEVLKKKLDDLVKDYQAAMAQMAAKEAEFRQQNELGLMSTMDYQNAVVELHKKTAKSLQDLIDKMTELANNPLASPEEKAKITSLIPTVNNLRDAYTETAKTMHDQVQSEFVSLFENVRNGSMGAIDSVRNLAKNIVSIIGQLLSKNLGEQIFAMLMPQGGSVNWFSTALSWMGFGGHASGGYISGPGTGTSDSIPARLSNGEYVVNATSVRALGVDFLDRLNGFRGRPRFAFATGGLAIGDGSTQAGSSAQVFEHRFTVGLDRGLILETMESAEGTRVNARQMQRNRRTFGRALGR